MPPRKKAPPRPRRKVPAKSTAIKIKTKPEAKAAKAKSIKAAKVKATAISKAKIAKGKEATAARATKEATARAAKASKAKAAKARAKKALPVLTNQTTATKPKAPKKKGIGQKVVEKTKSAIQIKRQMEEDLLADL